MAGEIKITIRSESDIVTARQEGRKLAAESGFSNVDQVLIATAISEVARNILSYAATGEIIISQGLGPEKKKCITIIARDEGPGIPDIELAMRDGYSTGKRLGLGLPGARRLMDSFHITSEVGKGTQIIMKKWKE
jgi:serine/threonine-protein kinase RsbT